jgi:AraC-like DNA-binding protein
MTPMLIHLCGLAAAVFITAGLLVAAVRWFHMCPPYDRDPHYYYPGRPFVTAIYLNALLLIPYALHPESGDAWYLARIYFLPVTISHFTVLVFSYFGVVMHWKKWLLPILLVGVPVSVALLAAFVLAVWPGEQIGSTVNTAAADFILYVLGAITTGIALAAMAIVLYVIRGFDEDEYSNPADFPVVSTRRWMGMIALGLLFCWIGVASNNRAVLAVVMLLMAASAAVFIISALHPNRNRPLEDMRAEVEAAAKLGLEPDPEPSSEEEEQLYQRSLTLQKRLEILSAVTTVVEEQEAYLEPHLTLQELAERCGYNRSYVSGLIKSELGGFFTYVNRLRIAHVESYLHDHPTATVEEAAEESGFASRKAYYAAKAKMRG